MANIMSLSGLKNHPSRDAYDMGMRRAFTAKVGEYLPVYMRAVLPGDKWKNHTSWITRTQPVNTAAYTSFREYYDWYFVPLRLLWRSFPDFITQMDEDSVARSLTSPISQIKGAPIFSSSDLERYIDALRPKNMNDYTENGGYDASDSVGKYDIMGYERCNQVAKLLDLLGYGNWTYRQFVNDITDTEQRTPMLGSHTVTSLSPFPLAAYQKIYQDYLRDSLWEKRAPETYNFDYIVDNPVISLSTLYTTSALSKYTPNLFDIRYANWNKDLFMGVMPSPQFGSESVAAPLMGNQRVDFGRVNPVDPSDLTKGFKADLITYPDKSTTIGLGLPVMALRQAEFLQKWKEIAQSGRTDYKAQMQKHWNVDVPDVLSNRCTYIGGTSSTLNIGEVVNTNLADSDSDADIAGKGYNTGDGFCDFTAKEHGIIMCIYHCIPLLEYTSDGLCREATMVSPTDWPIPEFDRVGMESVPLARVAYGKTFNLDKFLGYAPRYIDFKTSVDLISGEFKFSLSHWVAGLSAKDLVALMMRYQSSGVDGPMYAFFKVNPRVCDSIFAVSASYGGTSTDQLLCRALLDIKLVRNLDRTGLPY